MKLTKEQFVKYLNVYKRILEEENEVANTLNICEWRGQDWVGEYYDLFHDMCEADTNRVFGSIVDYYVFEMDFGTKHSEENQDIATPEALYDYIIELEKESKQVTEC